MADVISKLTTNGEQLTEELADAKKNVRHWQYELGVAQAALERQSEQAMAVIEKRTQLEEEVNLVQEKAETTSFACYESKHEAQRLGDEVQDLEDQIAAIHHRRAEKEEQRKAAANEMGQRAVATEADRRNSQQKVRAPVSSPSDNRTSA